MVFPNEMRFAEEKEAIHIRDIDKVTAFSDKEIQDEFEVLPKKQSGLDEHSQK